jgi:N-acetylglutamate synthase-like GNAT family acetyltransferase
MIRKCKVEDLNKIHEIINDAAVAYHGEIPEDCYREPYMDLYALESEIDAGVEFWVWEETDGLKGVMGIQTVKNVTLIRHAYVRTDGQGRGIGGSLLKHLLAQVQGQMLVGTWAAAHWAIALYERHGFKMTIPGEKDLLLDEYWTISPRQKDKSVVLWQ